MSGQTPSRSRGPSLGRSLGPSGHVDDFARRNLPPFEQWPDLLLDRAEFQYPEYLNAAVELTDRIVEKGFGDRIALIGNGRQRTYKELADWSNRLAHALVENYGVKPGNRVLIRSGNNPALVAAWLAATKAGAVVVNTMPMLRAGELSKIVDKAEIALALTDSRIADELVQAARPVGLTASWACCGRSSEGASTVHSRPSSSASGRPRVTGVWAWSASRISAWSARKASKPPPASSNLPKQ